MENLFHSDVSMQFTLQTRHAAISHSSNSTSVNFNANLSSTPMQATPYYVTNSSSPGHYALPRDPYPGNQSATSPIDLHDVICHLMTDDNNQSVVTSLSVYVIASLTFTLIGLVGNALSVLVFSSREMLPFSSNVYLLTLAVSDSLYLLSVLLSKG